MTTPSIPDSLELEQLLALAASVKEARGVEGVKAHQLAEGCEILAAKLQEAEDRLGYAMHQHDVDRDEAATSLASARAEIADLKQRLIGMTRCAADATRDTAAALAREGVALARLRAAEARGLQAGLEQLAETVTGRPYQEVAAHLEQQAVEHPIDPEQCSRCGRQESATCCATPPLVQGNQDNHREDYFDRSAIRREVMAQRGRYIVVEESYLAYRYSSKSRARRHVAAMRSIGCGARFARYRRSDAEYSEDAGALEITDDRLLPRRGASELRGRDVPASEDDPHRARIALAAGSGSS